MAWAKGQSGNAYGRRPSVNAFRTLCKDYSYKAFEMLKEIVEDRALHEAVRFQGLKFILESAYGKASQSIEVSLAEGIESDKMTHEQLALAASGQTEELVYNLIKSGKYEEYKRKYDQANGEPALIEGSRVLEGKEEREVQVEIVSSTNTEK